jgi:N-acetylated-alpha-linked acidic dipeptidase
LYDDYFWMTRFGDPDFAYHVTLAKILGTLVLRLDEADVLPFDYSAYAESIQHEAGVLTTAAKRAGASDADLAPLADAAAQFREAAQHAAPILRGLEASTPSVAQEEHINMGLAGVERAFLSADGLPGRPWYKHTLWAPGSYAGYSAVMMPGLAEGVEHKDIVLMRREAAEIASALNRGSATLEEISRLAKPLPAEHSAN